MSEEELRRHIEALERNPAVIAAAVAGLDERTLRFKPEPNEWCVLEVLSHLADVEIIYGYRMRQVIADRAPTFGPIEPEDWARNLGYTEVAPEEALTLYRTVRRANLRLLRRLGAGDLVKGGFHPELNRQVTLGELIERLAGHDPNHLGQIEALKRSAGARS